MNNKCYNCIYFEEENNEDLTYWCSCYNWEITNMDEAEDCEDYNV